MRNPQGNATIVGDLRRGGTTIIEGGVRHHEPEIDTFTCGHCNRIVHVPARADPANIGGLCKQCMGLVCNRCYAKGSCTPWEQKMLEAEARDHWRRTIGEY